MNSGFDKPKDWINNEPFFFSFFERGQIAIAK
jgi:hypothetical protein